jgi:hypothetical protein
MRPPSPAVAKGAVYSLAFVHLTLIAAVIFHGFDRLALHRRLEAPLTLLNDLNYSVWRFGFFAPDVGPSTEVEIRVLDDDGTVHRYSTVEGFRFFSSNLESAGRFYGFKKESSFIADLQDLAARSAATRLFNLHPRAWRVEYAMRAIRYPTMKDFRAGAAPEAREFYATTFEIR